MARNDTRPFTPLSADRAQPRAGVDLAAHAAPHAPTVKATASWRALAAVTVASALVVAMIVSAVALIDAVTATSPSLNARNAPASTEMQARRACVLPDDRLPTAPMQVDPALFVND